MLITSSVGKVINCRGQFLNLTTAKVMGIVNITPDSYYITSRKNTVDSACDYALQMLEEGAAVIDMGGESTRPGAIPITEDEEIARVIPVIKKLRTQTAHPISVDTSSAVVIQAALDAGASFINDVRALTMPGALSVVAQYSDLPVCLMHMQGNPQTMQDSPNYIDVVAEVKSFLQGRITACVNAGIDQHRILIDPGFGFGKTVQHNLQLLHALPSLQSLDVPVVAGLSRKAMIGALLGLPVTERLPASLALAVLAVMQGAKLIRVHDVKPTVEAIAMVTAMIQEAV